jgi:hypothetical protein
MGADLADSPAAVSTAADLAGSTAPVSIGPDPQVISSGCRLWQPEETIGREAGGDRPFAQHGNQPRGDEHH